MHDSEHDMGYIPGARARRGRVGGGGRLWLHEVVKVMRAVNESMPGLILHLPVTFNTGLEPI